MYSQPFQIFSDEEQLKTTAAAAAEGAESVGSEVTMNIQCTSSANQDSTSAEKNEQSTADQT